LSKRKTNKSTKKLKGQDKLPEEEYFDEEDSSDNLSYKYKNFYKSETQLDSITYNSPPEKIIEAFDRLIYVHSSNHVREGIELDDLIAEGRKGICIAIQEFQNPEERKKKNYNFQQGCLYKVREAIYQYCLGNVSQIKTPYYIQRGCMHVGQIFKLMSNLQVAEELLKKKGHASEHEIISFIYNEDERLPNKPLKYIKKQIKRDPKSPEFKQILDGVLNHKRGSGHSFVKSNLTGVGKVLHIKEKLWYAATRSNGMSYKRVIDLILSARQSQVEYNPNCYIEGSTSSADQLDTQFYRKQMMEYGSKACGERNFEIFTQNKLFDKTYSELSELYSEKKSTIVDIVKNCIKILRNDKNFQEMFQGIQD